MSPQDKQALRGFAWQAALIAVPMIALAVMGLTLLRKDKALVEQEARERAAAFANALADDLAEALSRDLRIAPADSSAAASPDSVPSNGVVRFMIDSSGRPIQPPPIEPLPTPSPFPVHELTSDQHALWDAAQRAEFIEHNHTNGISAMEALLRTEPNERLDAIIRFNLGVLSARVNQTDEARQLLGDCAKLDFTLRAESGVPIRTLANLKLLDLTLTNATDDQADHRIWLSSVCRDAVNKPTMLSPLILDKARLLQIDRTIERDAIPPSVWQSLWEAEERGRAMLDAATQQGAIAACLAAANEPQRSPSASAWFKASGEWLAEVATNGPPVIIVCRSASQLESLATDALRRQRFDPHTIANVRLGSRGVSPAQSVAKAARDLANVSRHLVSGTELAVTVRLADPDALFAQQRWRTRWFGLLIVAASVVTLIGLALSWRAFRRQLRLSEMKSNFVSSVSHELRAPVASVRLMAEGLESGRIHDEPKRRDYFRFIVQECRRLTGLIENVLDFARIEQGRKHYEFEETDIAALVRQTVKLMEPYAIDKRIALSIETAAAPIEALQASVDPRAIQQALVNLIDNAIKHSPPGETVIIGAGFSHSPSPIRDQQVQHLRLWVEDRGPGIPAAEHERVFERFYRRGSELRRETQGVGIGLSIVKHIVEAHGGRVIVRSTPGRGSRFTIELPAPAGVGTDRLQNERAVPAPKES